MELEKITRIVTLAMVFVAGSIGTSWSITCEQCLKIEKLEQSIQYQLETYGKDLQDALNRGEISKVTILRKKVNDLRTKLIRLKRQGQGCSSACKPEQIKAAECNRLKLMIRDLEKKPGADIDQIDKLYMDLAKCNTELAQM